MATLLNKYLGFEKSVPLYDNSGYMPSNAGFTKGKNEIYPIPQVQIDLSVFNGEAALQQNPNY